MRATGEKGATNLARYQISARRFRGNGAKLEVAQAAPTPQAESEVAGSAPVADPLLTACARERARRDSGTTRLVYEGAVVEDGFVMGAAG